MDGVAGHAGLFSSAPDLSICARMLLNNGYYGEKRYFKKSTINLFTTTQLNESSRGLGWDTGNGGNKYRIGNSFSEAAFGHTGFTGTSIWIDTIKNIFIIFLSNRTYKMKNREEIYNFRPILHDAILEDYGNLIK